MDPLDPQVVAAGLAAHPAASVLVLPRRDGQYSHRSPDVLALLDEVSVQAEYATDPMATGLHEEKSDDVLLPLLLVVGSISNWTTTIDGLIYVANYFVARVGPKGTVRFRAAYYRSPDGEEFTTVELDLPGDQDPADAIRAALARPGATGKHKDAKADRRDKPSGRTRPPKRQTK